jgi:hypothetical protein
MNLSLRGVEKYIVHIVYYNIQNIDKSNAKSICDFQTFMVRTFLVEIVQYRRVAQDAS